MNVTIFSNEIEASNISQSQYMGMSDTYGLAASAESTPFEMLKTMVAIKQPNNFSTRSPLEFDVKGFVKRLTNDAVLGAFNDVDPETVKMILTEVANALPRNRSIWRDLVTSFIGTGEKSRIDEVRMEYPKDIRALVESRWNIVEPVMTKYKIVQDTTEWNLIRSYAYEFVSAQALRFTNANGWTQNEFNVTRRLPPVTGVVQYDDLRTAITMYELMTHLERFDSVNWKKAYTDYLEFDSTKGRFSSKVSRRRVSAVGMASSIVNAIALTVISPTINLTAQEILDSVMFCLVRRWYPELPLPVELRGIVDTNDMLADLATNHAFFHMHQTNIKNGKGVYTLRHPVTTLAPTIFVQFKRAIDALLPYKTVTIGESVEALGIASVYNHLQEPTLRHIREQVEFKSGTDVFHISTLENQTFIDPVSTLGSRIDSVAEVVAAAVRKNNVDKIDRMIHEETDIVNRLSTRGTQLVINYDSMIDEGLQHGISPTALGVLLDPDATARQRLDADLRALYTRLNNIKNSERSGSVHTALRLLKSKLQTSKQSQYMFSFTKKEELPNSITDLVEFRIQKRMVERLSALMYFKTTLLAIYFADSVSLVYPEDYSREVDAKIIDSVAVGLEFEIHTNLVEPLGYSAILDGRLRTTEPLEVLVYARDTQAATSIMVQPTRLPQDVNTSDTAQDWAWFSISKRLAVRTKISGSLGGSTYSVDVTERDILSVAADVSNLYRTANTALVAASYTYVRSVLKRVDFMETALSTFKSTDPRVLSYQSMIKGELTKLLDVLSELASTPAAISLRATLMTKIRAQMDGQGKIDLYGPMDKLRFKLYTDLRIGGILLAFLLDDDIDQDLTKMISLFTKYSMFSDLLARRIQARAVNDDQL